MSTFIFENLISEKIISSSWGLLNLLYPAAAGVGLIFLLNRLLKPRFGWPWRCLLYTSPSPRDS